MKGAEVFPSKYLKSADLQGRRAKVTMAFVQMEKMGDDEKPVLYFAGKERGLVLNRTKWDAIGDLYGDDSDGWTDKPIVLAPGKTSYQGKRVDCIDVYPPDAAPSKGEISRAAQAPASAPVANVKDKLDDEIPF